MNQESADKALILVDIQNDFLPTGALPVPEGDQIVPVVNRLQQHFDGLIVASQDWHPPGHMSFASSHPGLQAFDVTEVDGLEQTLWPDHCVQGTSGAGFVPELDTRRVARVFRKGTDPRIDSYSAFHDNGHRKATGLADWLREHGVQRVCIAGLAADVCVHFTAMDAIREGFDTIVLRDATRGVNLRDGDVARCQAELQRAGGRLLDSAELTPA